jgi:hypothetical protein
VIVGDRLTEPFSVEGGRIQLTPLPADYQPKISSTHAAALLSGDSGGGWPGIAQPPLFLAMLINYGGPFSAAVEATDPNPHIGPTPVWVSLVYVQQILYGPPSGSHAKLPPLPLGDQVTTISAETGKFTSGIDVAGPDPVAITSPPSH